MLGINVRRAAAAVGLAASLGLAAFAPQAHASAEYVIPFYPGEHLLVMYPDSPLRTCPSESCSVMTYMPKSNGNYPGGGWVTSVIAQMPTNAFCKVNYRGIVGWTGCWRLQGIPGS
jgi:hypothetical protein